MPWPQKVLTETVSLLWIAYTTSYLNFWMVKWDKTYAALQVAGEVKCHKYSRRRPDNGWSYMVEKLGPQGKRGAGGGWKFISLPDGSSRPLNDMEKMYVKRETPKRRRRIIAPYKWHGEPQFVDANFLNCLLTFFREAEAETETVN